MSSQKQLNIYYAVAPIVILTILAALTIFKWDAGMFIPLLGGIVASAIVGLMAGFKWAELEKFIAQGVARALPAIFILFLIGVIVGTWILSGVIPTIIYYGLGILSPKIFLPAVALITGIVSMTLGSSFTSLATVGLALMAIGSGLGFPAPIVAGAVISGAFLGDKLSPLSDTTNIAPVMADTDLFSHIRHMLWDTIPAFAISLILYWVVGLNYSTGAASDGKVQEIMQGLDKLFLINPLLLILPLLTLYIVFKRLPAVPSLIFIIALGALAALFVQGSNITQIVNVMTDGYKVDSGVETIDSLLNRGGITSMLPTIGLVVLATGLGGILDGTGAFKRIIETVASKIKSTGSLILSTIASTFLVGLASGEQYLSIILPARTFRDKYKERGLDTKNLSRCVEAAGTVGINLIPWSVTSVFASQVLGVSPMDFIPFIFFAFLVPAINIVYGYMDISIARKDYSHEGFSKQGLKKNSTLKSIM
ncbi:Na+/H+ antiporter NhaC [Siminovitchia terrae]|uniref:Na+/H+ antiporter NhaC n=1 Tax=Siminovitchia terrae TaxID=1914933 RepID=A0A429XDK4_SIMTE|nr:Na+/H+ antiporter NhaC [Siminovitchia terrae]RST61545.1 Na+/H+ antiporter NhaC [Siminovitchia terrae]GIN90530.1 Na+/H+ antiporter NhaC [Siminovitchia terrae]GIN97307.1 Na+/H+ antiporter NhaC [Siminovitchia terrae]